MGEEQPEKTPVTDPRVYFAAERTLLAWIRTGLAMMGFGFVVARLALGLTEFASHVDPDIPRRHGFSLRIGITLVVLGVVVNAAAAFFHALTVQRLRTGEEIRPTAVSMGVVVALVLASFGVYVALRLAQYL